MIDGINRAQANKKWYAKAGAIVALDPCDGAIRAIASYPTFDPTVYTRRKKSDLAPLLDPDVAEASRFSGSRPRDRRRLSARLDVQAGHRARGDAGAHPRAVRLAPCTGSYTVSGQTFKNWDPLVNELMTLPTALAQSCDTYFYQLGKSFYDLPPTAASRSSAGRRRSASAATGVDVGPETSGLLPTIDWKPDTFTKKTDPYNCEVDRLWKPGDSIQLAIGQKDMLASPLQMARFYALLANGGKLVTPHLVSAIEQGGAVERPDAGGDRPPPLPAGRERAEPRPGRDRRHPPGPLRGDALAERHLVRRLRPLPRRGRGQDGHGREGHRRGDYFGSEDTAWWCGCGPYESPELVVCAVIENGGFGGEAAAPAALQVFEEYFGEKATQVQAEQAD